MTELVAMRIPVTVTCRVLKLSRQPYYRWLANPITPSEVVEAYRANALFDAHRDDPEFGHRLLADEARDAGEAMADRTAWRIASSNGWWSAFGKKRGRNGKKPGPAVHDDLCTVTDENGRLRHEFIATTPHRVLRRLPASNPVRASFTSARSRTCSATRWSGTHSTPE